MGHRFQHRDVAGGLDAASVFPDQEQKEEKIILWVDDGSALNYDFYQHVSNDDVEWNVPTEILYGAFDDVVYVGSMMEFLENHPNSRLTVLSDAEHYLYTPEEKKFIKNWIKNNLRQ